MAPVKLQVIRDALESSSDSLRSYLNRDTGEIVMVTDDGIIAEDESLDEEALDGEPFLLLPGKQELDEWAMMHRFALERDGDERDELLDAIRGRGAFRTSKSAVHRLGIDRAWYQFRDTEFEAFAKSWLSDNEIEDLTSIGRPQGAPPFATRHGDLARRITSRSV